MPGLQSFNSGRRRTVRLRSIGPGMRAPCLLGSLLTRFFAHRFGVPAPYRLAPMTSLAHRGPTKQQTWLPVDQGGPVKFERVHACDRPHKRQRPVFFKKNAAFSEQKFAANGSKERGNFARIRAC